MPVTTTPEALWSAAATTVLGPAAVRCRGLRRADRRRILLDGLDLLVPIGARLLIVSDPPESGPLLLRILAGLARLDGGSIELAGLSRPGPDGWGSRVGYLGQPDGLPRWMTPTEALLFSARIGSLEPSAARRSSDRLLDQFGIQPIANRPIGRLPSGLVERVALAAALVTDPEVLLLDEPLRGHDPLQREVMLQPRGARRTVLVASRLPAADRSICDRVALIRDGRLALHVSVDELDREGAPLTRDGITELSARRPATASGSAGR